MAPASRSQMARGPVEHHISAQRRAHYAAEPADAQVIDEQPLDIDDVGHGDHGKLAAVGPAGLGIDVVRAGRAAASAQDIRTNDEIAVGVDGLAGANGYVPPARSSASSCRATCESPERAWQINTALSALAFSRP